MKLDRSKEWWLAWLRDEPDVPISAGVPADEESCPEQALPEALEATAPAPFGEFVHLLRRGKGMSIEEFAEVVDIEVREAQAIEEDPFYHAEARTIWSMARAFDLPQTGLNALAGLMVANDYALFEGQERFAARSASRSQLSDEEFALFNAVVATLSQTDGAHA